MPSIDHDGRRVEYMGLRPGGSEDFGVFLVVTEHYWGQSRTIQMPQKREHASLGAANRAGDLDTAAVDEQERWSHYRDTSAASWVGICGTPGNSPP